MGVGATWPMLAQSTGGRGSGGDATAFSLTSSWLAMLWSLSLNQNILSHLQRCIPRL
jgi:hypothetical protein